MEPLTALKSRVILHCVTHAARSKALCLYWASKPAPILVAYSLI